MVLRRREFLQRVAFTGAAFLTGADRLGIPCNAQSVASRSSTPKKLGELQFADEARLPLGRAFGSELDARLYTDLGELIPDNPIIPTASFYIRTGASDLLSTQKLTSIVLDGLIQRQSAIPIQELVKDAKPMGAHLMECAGNARVIHFGLMSVADWSGVKVSDVLDRVKRSPGANRVLIEGFDDYRTSSRSSLPGASWVFTVDDLKSSRAFLAVTMNGQPLTPDHGAPVRLIVPGWYGCTCIKWVNRISMIDDSTSATLQMQEYASRTLQEGVPRLARDFQPATIDQAAMPIRVEKWGAGERLFYRVIGILWGGSSPIKKLEIQFNPDPEYLPVESFEHHKNDPWSFWSQDWFPKKGGKYSIRLRVKDPNIRTRRLDEGFYVRTVEVSEV